MKKTLICIDRDGTLIYDEKDHLFLGKDPDWPSRIRILPGVVEGLKKLRSIPDTSLYMITNQPGVAILDFPLLTVEKAHEVCRYVLDQIKAMGIKMDGHFLCPHADSEYVSKKPGVRFDPALVHDCTCLKPSLGLVLDALKAENIAADEAGIYVIGSGVNVNVTLLFSVHVYREVAEAYLRGLERLFEQGPTVPGGHNIDGIASVASFFVSRVDTAVDKELEKLGRKELAGKTALANARIAYEAFHEIFHGPRWEKLRGKGAKVQRLLWGSTGTKNPLYPDTLYVDLLIGPNTVNTVPPATLKSFLDHGVVKETLAQGMDEAEKHLGTISSLGIELETITRKLLKDGVEAFARPFEALMKSIAEKRDRVASGA